MRGNMAGNQSAPPQQQQQMNMSTAAELPGILRRELDEELGEDTTPEDLPGLEAALQEAGFAITHETGGAEIELSRNQDGESISIEFNCEDMQEGEEGQFSSTATVSVSKGGDDTLVFHLNAMMDEVQVDRIAFGSVEADDVYAGATFSELAEDLQDSFNMYLYDRHVDSDLGSYILLKSEKKENDEYANWLKNVVDFVDK